MIDIAARRADTAAAITQLRADMEAAERAAAEHMAEHRRAQAERGAELLRRDGELRLLDEMALALLDEMEGEG